MKPAHPTRPLSVRGSPVPANFIEFARQLSDQLAASGEPPREINLRLNTGPLNSPSICRVVILTGGLATGVLPFMYQNGRDLLGAGHVHIGGVEFTPPGAPEKARAWSTEARTY